MSLSNRIEMWALSAVLCFTAGAAMAEVVVVVSAKSAVTVLSDGQVTDIFLGKASRFPNGELAVPIDQTEGSAERNRFYLEFAGKSPAQVKAHWSKIIFTGKGQPPKELSRDQEIKTLVASSPNYIGYIDRSAADKNVRIVAVKD